MHVVNWLLISIDSYEALFRSIFSQYTLQKLPCSQGKSNHTIVLYTHKYSLTAGSQGCEGSNIEPSAAHQHTHCSVYWKTDHLSPLDGQSSLSSILRTVLHKFLCHKADKDRPSALGMRVCLLSRLYKNMKSETFHEATWYWSIY